MMKIKQIKKRENAKKMKTSTPKTSSEDKFI